MKERKPCPMAGEKGDKFSLRVFFPFPFFVSYTLRNLSGLMSWCGFCMAVSSCCCVEPRAL